MIKTKPIRKVPMNNQRFLVKQLRSHLNCTSRSIARVIEIGNEFRELEINGSICRHFWANRLASC